MHETNLLIMITRTTIVMIKPPHPTPMATNNVCSFSVMKTNYMDVTNYYLFNRTIDLMNIQYELFYRLCSYFPILVNCFNKPL